MTQVLTPPHHTSLELPRRYLVGFDPRELSHHFTDVLVIGGGIAGFRAALGIPEPFRVLVVTKDEVRESSSAYAQGGIAGVLDPEDHFDDHIADTLAADHIQVFGLALDDEKAGVTAPPAEAAYAIAELAAGNSGNPSGAIIEFAEGSAPAA